MPTHILFLLLLKLAGELCVTAAGVNWVTSTTLHHSHGHGKWGGLVVRGRFLKNELQIFCTIYKFPMNILGSDFDTHRLLRASWNLISLFLGLINIGSRKRRCQRQAG